MQVSQTLNQTTDRSTENIRCKLEKQISWKKEKVKLVKREKTIWLPPGLQLTTTDLKIEKGSAQGGAQKTGQRGPLCCFYPCNRATQVKKIWQNKWTCHLEVISDAGFENKVDF